MASVLEKAEVADTEDQTAFNLEVWNKMLADRFLAGLPHRIRTDRYGLLKAFTLVRPQCRNACQPGPLLRFAFVIKKKRRDFLTAFGIEGPDADFICAVATLFHEIGVDCRYGAPG